MQRAVPKATDRNLIRSRFHRSPEPSLALHLSLKRFTIGHRRPSPFAQLVNAFQQLQQSDPSAYTHLTKQIATNLQSESQTAQSQGSSSVAGELSELANDFTATSQTGQLPNLQDLAQPVGDGSTFERDARSSPPSFRRLSFRFELSVGFEHVIFGNHVQQRDFPVSDIERRNRRFERHALDCTTI